MISFIIECLTVMGWGGGMLLAFASISSAPLYIMIFMFIGIVVAIWATFMGEQPEIDWLKFLVGWLCMLICYIFTPAHDSVDLSMFITGTIVMVVMFIVETIFRFVED